MSGVLRLSNNVTGRSTINASASNDQTYTLPAIGGTLVTGGASSELIFPPGTEALPGLHVQGDVDTGLYAPATNTLGISTGGNERLRIDSSGNVGIGRSNPSSRLHIETPVTNASSPVGLMIANDGSGTNTGSSISLGAGNAFSSTAGNIAGFYDGVGTALSFSTSNNFGVTPYSERMRINSLGNVGIGTNDPDVKLHVEGATAGGAGVEYFDALQLENTQTANVGAVRLKFKTNRDGTTGETSIAHIPYDGSGTAYLKLQSYQYQFYNQAGSSEYLRIDSSGNVGIGSSTINQTVGGRTVLGINGTSNALLNFNHSNTLAGFIYGANDEFRMEAEGVRPLIFKGNSLERMQIDSSGRVGIGTTPVNFGVNYNALQIHSASGVNTYLALTNSTTGSDASNHGFNIIAGGDNVTLLNRENGFINISTNDTERMRINSGGEVLINTTTVPSGLTSTNPKLVVDGSTTTRGGAGTVGTTYTSIPGATVGNENTVYLVTIRAIGDNNFYSTATYILNSGAYSKTYTELGTASNHFGNGALSSQLSSYSGTSSSIQVKRPGSGLASVIVHMFRLI